MQFESLVRYKALHQRYVSANAQFVDHLIDQADDNAEKMGLQKVQFLVSPQLKSDLVNVCEYLDMTQRQFLESVLADAVSKAWAIVQDEHAGPEELGYLDATTAKAA